MTASVVAPAKVNLTLHVTGRRDDGYHLIDSLVTFAPICDRLTVQDGNTLSLTVEGPESAGVPADMKNLALQAAEIFSEGTGASLLLEKFLPAAAGIGGGSADAAAALRGMLAMREDWTEENWDSPDSVLLPYAKKILGLGADVPMCLMSRPCRARGIGEKLDFLQHPKLPAVLVNPRVAVPTGPVFDRLASRENPPMPDAIPECSDAVGLIDWLSDQRNDLQAPAIELVPQIAICLETLAATDGCRLARMTGSGATCFALYETFEKARASAESLYHAHPDWWVAGCELGDQSKLAEPKIS